MIKYLYKLISLILVFLFTNNIVAQLNKYPGGVDNVQIWLKADDIAIRTQPNSNELNMWLNDINATDHNVKFTYDDVKQSGKLRPSLLKGSYKMNFNNAVVFSGKHFLASVNGITGFSNAITVFGVYIAEKGKNETRMYYMGFGSTDPTSSSTRHPSIGFSPKDTGGRVRLTAARDGYGGYEINTTALQTTYVPEGVGTYVNFRFSGADYSLDKDGAQLSGASVGALKPNEGIIIGGASVSTGFFSGQLGEIIVYNRKMSSSETNKIESYLATKYGITLDNAAYTSSKGTVFWPWGRTGQGYHNNIAGILKDDNTNISVSRSTASGAALTVNTVGTEFESGVGVTKQVPLPVNNSAIYWGTNIGSNYKSSKVSDKGCGYTEILEGKYWKFNKTNLADTTVEVRAGGEDFPYQGADFQVKMLLAKTEADARNHNWMAVIPGKYVGGELKEHLFSLPIARDELYITFGANVLNNPCFACSASEIGYFNFNSNNWSNGSTSVNNLLDSNGSKFDITYKTYSDGKENQSMLLNSYPRVSNGNILETRFKGLKGSDDNYSITTISLKDGASFAKFNIYGIDKKSTSIDMVEVVGYCGDITYKGSVVEAKDNYDKPFSVGSGIITGTKPSSITNTKARATIEFPHEVTKIQIKHKIHYNGKSRAYQSIGIGDFEFNCPRPAKPNADGIEFTLQGPKTVLSCSEFTYTFKIWNYSCQERYVKLYNKLPEGISLVQDGISSTADALSKASSYLDIETNTINIENIKLNPEGYTTIAVRVRFKDDAKEKVYENRAQLTYQSVNQDGKQVTIESCDYNNFTQCTSTLVEMVSQPKVLTPLVSLSNLDLECYKDGVIYVQASVYNMDKTIDLTNLSLVFTYNEFCEINRIESKLVPKKVEQQPGLYIVEDLTLKAGESVSLEFQIQAPRFLELIYAVTGNRYTDPRDVPDQDIAKIPDFGAELELISNSQDVCVNASFENTYKYLDPAIPFCGRDLSCYYPGVSGKVVKKNSDFVTISTLDRSKVGALESETINAILYLESKTKGFVLTRLSEEQILKLKDPVAGMFVYDTTNECLTLYNGKKWSCIVQSCPDY